MLFSFFKQHRNKTYNYTPRYYDERKERLDMIKGKYGLIEEDAETDKIFRRKNFRDDWKQNRKAQINKNSRIRFMVILTFLLLAAYIALNYLDIKII